MKYSYLMLIFLISTSGCKIHKASLDEKSVRSSDLNKLSEEFLELIQKEQDTRQIQNKLAHTNFKELKTGLITDEQKFAFWINIYNAYIQAILSENPEYYEDRRAFFNKEQINIGGEMLSFAKIEHGIIRKSQWQLGLGYIRKWFPGKFERKLRVDERDYRIHFALNCGATDCPPVAIYTPARIEEQLDEGTRRYLNKVSDYDSDSEQVKTSILFSWFRGDFGSKKGVKKILEEYDIISNSKTVSVQYKSYDWTLDLDNFIEL